jgi:hypothetical protein
MYKMVYASWNHLITRQFVRFSNGLVGWTIFYRVRKRIFYCIKRSRLVWTIQILDKLSVFFKCIQPFGYRTLICPVYKCPVFGSSLYLYRAIISGFLRINKNFVSGLQKIDTNPKFLEHKVPEVEDKLKECEGQELDHHFVRLPSVWARTNCYSWTTVGWSQTEGDSNPRGCPMKEIWCSNTKN